MVDIQEMVDEFEKWFNHGTKENPHGLLASGYYKEVKNYLIKSIQKAYKAGQVDTAERVYKLIACDECKGNKQKFGDSLGVIECHTCGGDGHCLYEHEGVLIDEMIEELLDTKQDS